MDSCNLKIVELSAKTFYTKDQKIDGYKRIFFKWRQQQEIQYKKTLHRYIIH